MKGLSPSAALLRIGLAACVAVHAAAHAAPCAPHCWRDLHLAPQHRLLPECTGCPGFVVDNNNDINKPRVPSVVEKAPAAAAVVEPVGVGPDPAGKIPRCKKAKCCEDWCEWIEPDTHKWIPECMDCEDVDYVDVDLEHAASMLTQHFTDFLMPSVVVREGAQQDDDTKQQLSVSKKKKCCKWCKMVPAFMRHWISRCDKCSPPKGAAAAAAADTGAAHLFPDSFGIRGKKPSKKECPKWCHSVPPATMHKVPNCKECKKPKPTGKKCPSYCSLVPESKAGLVPGCKGCYAKKVAAAAATDTDASAQKKECSKWCHFVPPATMHKVPNCMDCKKPKPTGKCFKYCSLVPEPKAGLVPGCKHCYAKKSSAAAAATDTDAAAATDTDASAQKNECPKWCDFVPPATMHFVPKCKECKKPKPTGKCPAYCSFVPEPKAGLVPGCKDCYAKHM